MHFRYVYFSFLLNKKFKGLLSPAEPCGNVCVEPLYNVSDISRGRISDMAVNASVRHRSADSDHTVGVVTYRCIFS